MSFVVFGYRLMSFRALNAPYFYDSRTVSFVAVKLVEI